MRRAVIATIATAAGLALLLGYKAGGTVKALKVTAAGGNPSAPATTVPGSTVPAGGTSTTAGSGTLAAPSGTYTGELVNYAYGDIEVSVTLQGHRIASVTVPQNDATDARSQMINSEAIPILEQEVVTAQGLNFDAVSGATFTSDAFAQSLQSALQKAAE